MKPGMKNNQMYTYVIFGGQLLQLGSKHLTIENLILQKKQK